MKRRPRAIAEEDDDPPVNPAPVTVHAQPRPRLYDNRGRRLERAIGYRPELLLRTDRDD